MWDKVTYPLPNFNGATAAVEVWEWISNFIPHFTGHVISPIWFAGFVAVFISKASWFGHTLKSRKNSLSRANFLCSLICKFCTYHVLLPYSVQNFSMIHELVVMENWGPLRYKNTILPLQGNHYAKKTVLTRSYTPRQSRQSDWKPPDIKDAV